MALNSPFTLAIQIVLSPQGNSLAVLGAGSSDWTAIFVKGIVGIISRLRAYGFGQAGKEKQVPHRVFDSVRNDIMLDDGKTPNLRCRFWDDVIPNRRAAAVRNLLFRLPAAESRQPQKQVPHRVFDSVRNGISFDLHQFDLHPGREIWKLAATLNRVNIDE